MTEWREYKLGEFIKVKHGFAFKGDYIVPDETDKILVTPGNFHIGGGFKSDKFKYYNCEDFPQDYILKSGDIVVTMTDLSKDSDTLGYSAIIPFSKNKKYLHNQRIGLVQFISNKVCPDFVYWLLRTKEYQSYIVGSASGTSIMHTSPSRIENYSCLFPPLNEQRRIASILSSLDDKIDLLHRENATLEQMAETLFRQWFVVEAKEEWKEGLLGDLIDIGSGKGLQRTEFVENGSYSVLGANGEIGKTNKYLVDETNRVVYTGRVGTLGNVFRLENKKAWLSDNTLVVRPKDYYNFVYFVLKCARLQDFNVGSTQPLIRQSDIKEIEITIPKESKLIAFEEKCNSLFKKIDSNNEQIQTLIQMRDGLLPRLMGGEVKI